jgi:hypothetical protein
MTYHLMNDVTIIDSYWKFFHLPENKREKKQTKIFVFRSLHSSAEEDTRVSERKIKRFEMRKRWKLDGWKMGKM